MTVDEEYKSNFISEDISSDLSFHLATTEDVDAVFNLMKDRNPYLNEGTLLKYITKEVQVRSNGKEYGLFVAKYENKVVGFCRYFHSESVPKEKIKYDSPLGYYGMGICVVKEFRGRGVAKFLSKKRFEWLKSIGVSQMYSCVSIDNKVSHKLHKILGFSDIGSVDGALTVSFEPDSGILYLKQL